MNVRCERDVYLTHDGLKLVRREWIPERPSRALAIVHGMAEHSERYDFVGRWLAERGYAVHAFDQRGHGESDGPRNHAPSLNAMLEDIERFLALVRQRHASLPLVLLGHSMGGLEVACLMAMRSPEVSACVLSAPALAPATSASSTRVVFARALSRLLPLLRMSTGIDPAGLSRDPRVVQAYVADPRIDTKVTLRLAAEFLGAVRFMRDADWQIRRPILVLHGEDDPLCLVSGSRDFHARMASEGAELRTYPGLLHEILNEPEREQVLADLQTWIEKRVPTGMHA